MNNINNIGPIREGGNVDHPSVRKPGGKDAPSFKETMKNFMTDVNQMQQKADQSIEKMVSGEINDVHQVMNAVEEAKLAFNMMMEIRNKVMDAYQEVMRIRV